MGRRSPASTDFATSIVRLGLPLSKVAVASWAPPENNSAGFGARSTYCPVRLATRDHGRSWIRPTLALFGVKLGDTETGANPPAAGSVNSRAVPDRSTRSIRPAI